MKSLTITQLGAGDAASLSEMLSSSGPGYSGFFDPFSFDAVSLSSMLSSPVKDKFWGVRVAGELAAFFMLRGLDAGYDIPSYGVYVAERYAGRGLASLTLRFAGSWCRLNGVGQMMIKVHPDNLAARHIYESAGAVRSGADPKNSNIVYHLDCGRPA